MGRPRHGCNPSFSITIVPELGGIGEDGAIKGCRVSENNLKLQDGRFIVRHVPTPQKVLVYFSD